jgi:PemK-like, MazF-like toxin of type II toxin-antitoxin system
VSEQRPDRGGAFDFRGRLDPQYAPKRNGQADPGEVVWAWVPFEEDPSLGKDRPAVVVGRDADDTELLVVLMLSSKHHDGDPDWYPLGAGGWDAEQRPSWVRLDRALAVTEDAVRREGAAIPAATFLDLVEHAVARRSGRPVASAALDASPSALAAPAARRSLTDRLRSLLHRSG